MKTKIDEFVPAKKHVAVTTGEAIRMLRELKGWTQEELAKRSGINGMISLFEVITHYGTGDPKILAGGISEALITTQTGLALSTVAGWRWSSRVGAW